MYSRIYNYGKYLDFCAPAIDIELITGVEGGGDETSYMSGTSFSTPMIAGIFANYKQAFPDRVNNESKEKISLIDEMNFSVLKFKFDTDVDEYKVNILGSSHDTGIEGVHSTDKVFANTEITILIFGENLPNEGLNRVNIYGRNFNGWTLYDKDGS